MKSLPRNRRIAAAVKQELDADMATFGFEIVNVLVTDIVPDAKVKSAMNDINAAQREQVAANARGEAEKILVVKKAEAEAESKALQGQGIANQRKAIIEGLQVSIEQFQKVVEGASSKEVMQLVLVTQYFDTLKSIGESDKTNTLFLATRRAREGSLGSDFGVHAGGGERESLIDRGRGFAAPLVSSFNRRGEQLFSSIRSRSADNS